MALRTCPDCNTEVSSHGIVCFKCGRRLSVEYRIMGIPFYQNTNPPGKIAKVVRVIIYITFSVITYNMFFSQDSDNENIAEADTYKTRKYSTREATSSPAKAIYEIPKAKKNELAKF